MEINKSFIDSITSGLSDTERIIGERFLDPSSLLHGVSFNENEIKHAIKLLSKISYAKNNSSISDPKDVYDKLKDRIAFYIDFEM